METQEAEVTEKVTDEPPAKAWEQADEERARLLGWKAPEEWKGEQPPQGLIEDPREYNKRAESILPFKKLQESHDALEARLTKSDEHLRRVESVYEAALKRQREAHDRQLQSLRDEQARAVETGDTDAWKAARDAEDQLREAAPQEAEPPKQEIPEETRRALDQWRVDNMWLGQDAEKTATASAAWKEAEQAGIVDVNAILKLVDRRIAEKHAPPQRQQAAVESGLQIGGSVEPFSKLPADAKDAFKLMVQQGIFQDTKDDRAQYVKDYEG